MKGTQRGGRHNRVLIDLSNIASGGGLQVAASFLDELGRFADEPVLAQRWPWLPNTVVEASPAVQANATYRSGNLDVRTVIGSPLAKLRRRSRLEFEASFLIFGPDYSRRRAAMRIVGFADGTSLFPELAMVDGIGAQMKHQMRRRVSRARFRSSELVVVEAPHVAETLVERWGIDAHTLRVVPNVLNGVFKRSGISASPLNLPPSSIPRACFPTRLHPHKNLNMLGAAARELHRRHGLQIEFVLTLTPEEWRHLDAQTRKASRSVGALRIAQLPSLYASCQAAIFLSSNECFSVTPLEAMATGTPLVASDRAFVRSVADDAAWYCEPLDPASVADALARTLEDVRERRRRVERGLSIATAWPTPDKRAAAYLDIIDEALRGREVLKVPS